MMYRKLSAALHRKRIYLSTACEELGIDPSIIEPELLSVVSCDDCGIWEKPSKMTVTADGSNYCKLCINSNYT